MNGLPAVPGPRDVALGRLRALKIYEIAYAAQIGAIERARAAERIAIAAGCRPSDIEATQRMLHDAERNAG